MEEQQQQLKSNQIVNYKISKRSSPNFYYLLTYSWWWCCFFLIFIDFYFSKKNIQVFYKLGHKFSFTSLNTLIHLWMILSQNHRVRFPTVLFCWRLQCNYLRRISKTLPHSNWFVFIWLMDVSRRITLQNMDQLINNASSSKTPVCWSKIKFMEFSPNWILRKCVFK